MIMKNQICDNLFFNRAPLIIKKAISIIREPRQNHKADGGNDSGDNGQTLVEYALILLLVVIVAVVVLALLGTRVTALFQAAVAVF